MTGTAEAHVLAAVLPDEDDMLADRAPHLPILEVPDNGLLVDDVTGAEMIEMFRANWPGGALATPTVYAIGHLAAEDRGPVGYVRMSDLPRVFPRP